MSPRSWLVFLVLGLPLPTQAASVTWVFEGTIAGTYSTSVDAPVEVPELTSLGVVAGTPFVATFTIELDAPDTDTSATLGRYDNAVLGVSFEAAEYGFSFYGPSSYPQLVVNVDSQILGAYYTAADGPNRYFANPLFFLEVEGAQPGVFALDAIPAPFPEIGSLEPFQYPGQPDLAFGYGSYIGVYGGSSFLLASLATHYAVPEPAAAALAAFGVLAVAVLRYRRSW